MPFFQSVANYLAGEFPDSRVRMHDPGGGRAMGTVVAPVFQGLYEEDRLRLVWDKLHSRFGPEATNIGVLLLFTPSEEAALQKAN